MFNAMKKIVSFVIVLAAVFLMTPTVFFSLQRIFDWGDILYDRIHSWLTKRQRSRPTGKALPPKSISGNSP